MSTFLIDTAQSEIGYRQDRIRGEFHRSPKRGWRRLLQTSDSATATRPAEARSDAAVRYRPALWVAHHS